MINSKPKILIIQLGKIGDMLLATPMFRAVFEKYPDSEIHVIAGRHNYQVIRNNPVIKKIFVYRKNPLSLLKLIYSLRKNLFDYYLDPKDHFSTESYLFSKIIRANQKIGFNKPGKRNFDLSVKSSEENKKLHFVQRSFAALKYLGIEFPAKRPLPDLYTNQESESYCNDFLSANKINDYIVINISAGSPNRKWQTSKWKEIIHYISSDLKKSGKNFSIVLSCVPEDINEANEIAGNNINENVFPSRNINDVFSLLRKSRMLISPDTAMVHIASAFNLPQITLHGDNEMNFTKFKPLGANVVSIITNTGEDNISGINPEEIIESYRLLSGLTFNLQQD